MANYSNLKAAIAAAIKTNGNQEITGQVLQDVLNSIVSVIGANYTFAGVATPSTNPGTPDQNVFYIAIQAGTYVNFGGVVINTDSFNLFVWDGTWDYIDVFELSDFYESMEEAVAQLLESYQPIVIEGDVTNAPDEEDLTSVNNLLKFKDKSYFLANYSGLGRKYLRKNLVNGVNTLTQAMISEENTIYHIQYDYEMAEDITIPANCVLKFDGGSIGGVHELIGTNTRIEYDGSAIFRTGVIISDNGTWLIDTISTKMFSDLSANNALRNVENLNNSDIQTTIIIEKEQYSYKFLSTSTAQDESGRSLIKCKSNTTYIVNGEIEEVVSEAPKREFFRLLDVENVYISGSGTINGNRLSFSIPTDANGNGSAFILQGAKNIVIEGISIKDCTGDGIYLSSGDTNIKSEKVEMKRLYITNNGRQGISLVSANNISIKENIIKNINGSPGSGVEIEPNHNQEVDNIHILNNTMDGCKKGVFVTKYESGVNAKVKDIFICGNNIINSTEYGLRVDYCDCGLFIIRNKVICASNKYYAFDYIKITPIVEYPTEMLLCGEKNEIVCDDNIFVGSIISFAPITNCYIFTFYIFLKNPLTNGCTIFISNYDGYSINLGLETGDVECLFTNNNITLVQKDYFGNTPSYTTRQSVLRATNRLKFFNNVINISNSGVITPSKLFLANTASSKIVLEGNDYPANLLTADDMSKCDEVSYAGAAHKGTTYPSFSTGDHIGFQFFVTTDNTIKTWNGSAWI